MLAGNTFSFFIISVCGIEKLTISVLLFLSFPFLTVATLRGFGADGSDLSRSVTGPMSTRASQGPAGRGVAGV